MWGRHLPRLGSSELWWTPYRSLSPLDLKLLRDIQLRAMPAFWEVGGFCKSLAAKELTMIRIIKHPAVARWGEGGWRIGLPKSLRHNIRGHPQSDDPPRSGED